MGSSPVNWLFLAELVVMVIVVSAFLFYWNRIFGGTVAFLIRLVSWRVYGVYLVIGSLQISPLAGRIAFRDVEYHSSNISFRALHGNVTFRYWKLRVRKGGDTGSGNARRARLPCRIALNVEGLELFCYNRTPAYDAIVERMKKHEWDDQGAEGLNNGNGDAAAAAKATAVPGRGNARQRKAAKPMERETSGDTGTTSEGLKASGSNDTYPPPRPGTSTTPSKTDTGISWLWEALPLEIKVTTGSVVLGSDATPMVLIVDYRRARGTLEMSDPRSTCDLYKMTINCGLQDVNVLMRTNLDYSGPLLAHGKNTYDEILKEDPELARKPPSELTSLLGFQWLTKRFKFLYDPHFSSPPVAGLPSDRVWKGLARYRLPEDNVGHVHREEREYAKVTTLLSTRALDLSYYTDSPGLVPAHDDQRDVDRSDEIGNIEPPPEWGIDLTIHGGNVNYGPWADRQRDALQKAFAPSIFFDSEPRARLKPGDTRVHSVFRVNVAMSEKTTLRIPTRESSKDWLFDGTKGDIERRYGWLDVVVGANSSVIFTQSQIATERGYESMVLLHLDQLDVASSVNMQSFVSATACKLSVTMPNPLVWNAQRNWGLDLNLDTPDIQLLREHVTLISDLAKDWSGGTGADFRHFVPMHYSFRIAMVQYRIQLFINDFNIVDVPKSTDHNALLEISGPRLASYVAVDSSRYRPEFSVVPFTVDAKNVVVKLCLPTWDTHRSFGQPSLEVGKAAEIKVSGSYRYYSTPSPEHIEKLNLHIEGERVAFKALGWVVRRIFCVKENYFGNFTQFSTMQEYLEKFDHSPDSVGDPIVQKYRPGRSDPFSVKLTVDVHDSLIVMPDEIYGCEKGITIPVPSLLLDLKTNEYQMDMSLDAAPTYAAACDNLEQAYTKLSAPLTRTQDVVFVEGIDIHANRLFGPQPHATTYFCLWELGFSSISAFLSPEFTTTLAGVGTAIGYNYTDHDNAPASIYQEKTPPDATFVKLSINHVSALISSGDSGIAVELPNGLFIDTSSMASKSCGSVKGLGVPTVSVHILSRKSANKRWKPIGSVATGLSLDNYQLPSDWKAEAEAQMAFLKEQDAPTRRVPYLYGEPDDKSYGRHYHDVYVPRPREVSIPWADSDPAPTPVDEPVFDDSSDSASQSDSTTPSVPMSRVSRRKRAMSVATMQETLERHDCDSIGDESDSVSSSSGPSSLSSFDERRPLGTSEDMAVILEDRLKSFKRIHQRARRLFANPSTPPPNANEEESAPPVVPLAISEGAIYKIRLAETTVELNTDTLHSAVDVSGAMSAFDVRPEIVLDQLLSHQVGSVVKDHSKRSAKLYDFAIPLLDLRLVQGSFSKPESIIHAAFGSPLIRLRQTPEPNCIENSMSATGELHTLQVTLSRRVTSGSTLSLLDVPNFEAPSRHHDVLPFVRISSSAFVATFGQVAMEKTIQMKANGLSLQSATPGIPITTYLIDTWEPIFKSLPKHASSRSAADVIYDTLNDAIEAGLLMSLPEFMYESPYALQFNDQRSIRHDVGWFTLSRLRHWMALLKDMPQQPRPASPGDKTNSIVSALAALDAAAGVTKDVVVAQPYLRKALGHLLDDAGLTPESRMDSAIGVFVDIESTDVRHYGRMLHTGAIASSAVTVDRVSIRNARSKTWQDDIPSITVVAGITVERLVLDFHDSFLTAVQAFVSHIDDHREEISELPVVQAVDQATSLTVTVVVGELAAGVTGGGLRLDLSITDAQGNGTLRRSQRTQLGCECHSREDIFAFVTWKVIQATLKEAHDVPAPEEPERDLVVAAIRSGSVTAESTIDSFAANGGSARLIIAAEAVEFNSRPQLKAFFDFAKDWRKNHFPLYQPTIEQIQSVIAVRRAAAMCRPPQAVPDQRAVLRSMTVDLMVDSVHMQARAAKGLWLGWDMGKVYAMRKGSQNDLQFGLHLDAQVVGAYTSAKRIKTKEDSVIQLPSVTITGTYRKVDIQRSLEACVTLGMFIGIIKPTVLDRLLSLHQRLGNDVLAVVREYRGRDYECITPATPATSAESPVDCKTNKKNSLIFRITARVEGVRVGLRADNVPTTLMFEALKLEGSASTENSALMWSASANHVGLSLIRLAEQPSYQTSEPLRGSRSVYMEFDISTKETPGTRGTPSQLSINLTRVHTVMHVAALSELGDLIRSWSADISVLRDVHAREVAEVKEQTTRVLKKLDVGVSSPKDAPSVVSSSDGAASIESWFAQRVLKAEVKGIGIAIPLDAGATIDVSRSLHGSGARAALLFSIEFMGLTTSRTETARFHVQQTALKFVDRFDPRQPKHFQGTSHQSTNYMVLPSIVCEGQMNSSVDKLEVTAHCSATDFRLALTPEIADGIARLSDLYEHGKEHLLAMERDYKAEWAKHLEDPDTVSTRYEVSPIAPSAQQMTVRVSLSFDSGVVELHRITKEPGQTVQSGRGGNMAGGHQRDRVTLPTVSVWVDYRGGSSAGDDGERALLFNMAVHESRNVIHPTVLPFFVEIAQRVEQRAKSRPQSTVLSPASPTPPSPPPPLPPQTLSITDTPAPPMAERVIERIADSSTSKLRLTFTLRIDSSELRLSCVPDSKAYLDLKWESGGFTASTLVGAQGTTTVAGTVSGVTAYLSHEFAAQGQGCVEASAKDLAFSMTLCTIDGQRGLSIVVDTEVSVEFRLVAFSAWLIFMAIWVDNAPKFDMKKSPESPSSTHMPTSPLASNKLCIVTAIRFRKVDFEAELGSSQAASLEMSPIGMRTKSNGEVTEADLTVGTTLVKATGDISGDIRSESFKFSTIRRSSRSTDENRAQALKMKIEGGDLRGNLSMDDTNIFRFQLKPSVVTLTDNWKDRGLSPPYGPVYLDFIIAVGDFSGVLRLSTIPRLLGPFYDLFDLAASQTRIATQRSEMFMQRQKQKEEDQTPMTTVVLPMSREENDATDKQAAPRAVIKTNQMMRFTLSSVSIGIFADTYEDRDPDFYRFLLGQVTASLQLRESETAQPERELGLDIAQVTWQVSDGKAAARVERHDMSARELLDAVATLPRRDVRDVLILPSMALKMKSTELTDSDTLLYDFDLPWGSQGDLMITPIFFNEAQKSFKKLFARINEQQEHRAGRRGPPSSALFRRAADAVAAPVEKPKKWTYTRRGTGPFKDPLPPFRSLGGEVEFTGWAANIFAKGHTEQLPLYAHKFVTLKLEEGMKLLLKLYSQQLPPDIT